MLTHLDSQGRARMVDVSDKASTAREAVATGGAVADDEVTGRPCIWVGNGGL